MNGAAAALLMRIGLALVVFWLVILTLFMLSHILHDSASGGGSREKRLLLQNKVIPFTFPTNGSVSISFQLPSTICQYHTCCWDRTHRFLYCDGAFATVWDQNQQTMTFQPMAGSPIIMSDLQGGECTLLYA